MISLRVLLRSINSNEFGSERNEAVLNEEGIYFQLSNPQKKIQEGLMETQTVLRNVKSDEPVDPFVLEDEANNWYELLVDGKWNKVAKRVTDRTKEWYKRRFGDGGFTAEEKSFNNFKKEFGIKGHGFFQDIHNRYFDTITGERRTQVTKKEFNK